MSGKARRQIVAINWDIPGTFEYVKVGSPAQATKAMSVLSALNIKCRVTHSAQSEYTFQIETTLRMFRDFCDLINICFN